MRKLLLASGLALLLFCVACGSGSNGTIGNFSNASLSGHYAYELSGVFVGTNVEFREAGVFTADGNGHITSGTDDLTEGGSPFPPTPITGTYSISNDGTGTALLNFNPGQLALALTLVNSSKVSLIEADSFGNAAGVAEKQDTSAIASVPSGTFTFRLHSVSNVQGSAASVGAFTVTGGAVSGNEDVNNGGLFGPRALSGTFAAPDATGRGSASLTDSNNITSSFIYYVVNASTVRLLQTSPGIGLGRAEKQTGAPFANTSLSGSYAFGSKGDTSFSTGGVHTVGRFTAGGDGNISLGAFDSVQDGTSFANIPFTGTYAMASNGRAAVTLSPSTGGTVQERFWMVSPSRAFFLINDANKVEDGTLDLQQGASFSNSSLNGQFAIVMDGFDTTDFVDRVGTLRCDGAGNLTLNEFLNRSGVTSTHGPLSGTYSVAVNGRATGSINGLSNNLVFYLISGNDAYVLQNDVAVEIDGTMSKQP